MSRRYRSGTVEISIDIDEVFDNIDDGDLLDALKHRKLVSKAGQPIPDVEVERIYDALLVKDYDEALLICRQLLYPKWKSAQDAEKALEKARAA